MPDHSLMGGGCGLVGEVKGEAGDAVMEKRYRVQEGYLDDDVGKVIGELGMTRRLLMNLKLA